MDDLSLRLETIMPFPESQRVVFAKNPITQVIVQLQFPPILAILASPPAAFQERIRATYPLYSQEPSVTVPEQLATLLRQLSVPPQPQLTRHVFATADRRRSVSLTRDFIALEETSYARWELFRDEMQQLQVALQQVYSPAFFTRIGLRYVDVIDPEQLGLEFTSWQELINDKLLGILSDESLESEVGESASTFLLNVNRVPGGQVRLQHGLRVKEGGSRKNATYTIDVDLSTQRSTHARDVIPTLDIFNGIAGNLFRWSITRRLSEFLEPTALGPSAMVTSGDRHASAG